MAPNVGVRLAPTEAPVENRSKEPNRPRMPTPRTRPPTDLLLPPLHRDPGGLGRQLEVALRDAIRTGRLREGERLPPSRTLARELQVSRNVVLEAYAQLVAEGYLEARTRAGPH